MKVCVAVCFAVCYLVFGKEASGHCGVHVLLIT